MKTTVSEHSTIGVMFDNEFSYYLMSLCSIADMEPHELLCGMIKDCYEKQRDGEIL